MQISELIDKLNEILQEHGDIPVLDSGLYNVNTKVVVAKETYNSRIIELYSVPHKFCQIKE